jgi:hydroxymethylpyrimidine/phosphomethylpyrimidine kinase
MLASTETISVVATALGEAREKSEKGLKIVLDPVSLLTASYRFVTKS